MCSPRRMTFILEVLRLSKVLVLVGTRKGAFLFHSDRERRTWHMEGPVLPGMQVNHMAYDSRDGSVYAAANSYFYGPTVHKSTDLGKTWTHSSEELKYGPDDKEKVKAVWHVAPGPASEPGVVYAGVEHSGLFRSEDGGRTWAEVASLRQHPTHEQWFPGGGGKCLHTIELDMHTPGRMYIGASTGGIYRSPDRGATWEPVNKGIRAGFMPEGQQYPEAGQ